jgi:hypothetical protein
MACPPDCPCDCLDTILYTCRRFTAVDRNDEEWLLHLLFSDTRYRAGICHRRRRRHSHCSGLLSRQHRHWLQDESLLIVRSETRALLFITSVITRRNNTTKQGEFGSFACLLSGS